MGNESELLRMLEPAVRPTGLPGPAKQPKAPFESRSFESLLDEAKQMNASENQATPATADQDQIADGTPAQKSARAGLIAPLTQLDRIENSTLRGLIGNNKSGR